MPRNPSPASELLPDGQRNEGHRVVAENVDDLHGYDVAAGFRVNVARAREFQVAILTRAEALPLVFEDVGAGPAFLEVDEFSVIFDDAGQLPFHAKALRLFDDFFPALVVEIDSPVIYPVGPLLREHVARNDAVLVFADLDELALLADDFAFAFLQLGGDGLGDAL